MFSDLDLHIPVGLRLGAQLVRPDTLQWSPSARRAYADAASGTRYQRACTTRMTVFWPGNFILKTMMFRDVTTVLNERKHLKMVIRSVPDSVSLNLGRTECPGLTALHRAHQFQLMRHRTFLKYSCHKLC